MSKSTSSKSGPTTSRPATAARGGAGQGKGPGNAGGWPSTVTRAPSGGNRSVNPASQSPSVSPKG